MRAAASLKPVTRQVITGQIINVDNTPSVVFEVPNDLAEFRLILQVTAAAGTTPTLDAYLQDTPDEGQNWLFTGNKFAQMIAVDMRQLSVSRERHAAQAAAESTAVNPAIGAAASAVNGPLSRKQRIWFRISGAGATFTVNAFLIGNVPAAN